MLLGLFNACGLFQNTFTNPSFFFTFSLQNTYKRVLCLVFEKLEASVSLTAFFGLVLFNFLFGFRNDYYFCKEVLI